MKELVSHKYDFTHKYLKYFFFEIWTFSDSNVKVPILSKLDENMRIMHDYKSNFTPNKYTQMT